MHITARQRRNMLPKDPYISAACLQSVYNACLKAGIEKKTLLTIMPDEYWVEKSTIKLYPASTMFELLLAAQNKSDNLAFGLELGPTILLIEYFDAHIANAMMSSGSIRQCLYIIRRYHSLIHSFAHITIKPLGKITSLEWHIPFKDAEYCRPVVDMVLALNITLARWLSWTKGSRLAKIHLRHKNLGYGDKYQEMFGCNVLYEQESNAIFMNTKSLDLPLPQSNPVILRRECRTLDIALLSLENQKSIRVLSAQTIRAFIGRESFHLEKIAEKLNMNARSLRRHLKQENTSYGKILQNIRKDLSEQYLLEGESSLREIAKKLGYRDATAFNRAFKLWFGQTPQTYSRNMRPFA